MSQMALIIIVSVAAALSVGLITWLATRHAGQARPPKPRKHPEAPLPMPEVSDETLAKLQQQIAERYQKIIESTAQQFSADLATTSSHLSEQVKRLTTTVIADEMDKYRSDLEGLRKEAMAALASIQTAVNKQRESLAGGLETELAEQRKVLGTVLDARFADIISAFVVETLGNNVDLGAQGVYLMSALEQHKDELKKELLDVS